MRVAHGWGALGWGRQAVGGWDRVGSEGVGLLEVTVCYRCAKWCAAVRKGVGGAVWGYRRGWGMGSSCGMEVAALVGETLCCGFPRYCVSGFVGSLFSLFLTMFPIILSHDCLVAAEIVPTIVVA